MNCLIELKRPFMTAMFAFGFAVALTSCARISDELVLRKIKSANEPSDLFQAICVGTKADNTQIRRLATTLHWDEKPLSPQQKTQMMTGMFGVPLNSAVFGVGTGQGVDPEIGHAIEFCTLSYVGAEEPTFVQNVISKSGLQRVAQSDQIRKRANDAIVLSDTGRETDSFLVLPLEFSTFGLRTVMAFAIKPSK